MAYKENFLKPEAHAIGVVAKRIRKVMDKEGLSKNELAAISNITPRMVMVIKKGTGPLTSLAKMMHYLGYEIHFVKKRKTKKLEKNVAATKRYIKFKKIYNDGQRKRAGKPILTQQQLREQQRADSGNFLGTGD